MSRSPASNTPDYLGLSSDDKFIPPMSLEGQYKMDEEKLAEVRDDAYQAFVGTRGPVITQEARVSIQVPQVLFSRKHGNITPGFYHYGIIVGNMMIDLRTDENSVIGFYTSPVPPKRDTVAITDAGETRYSD
jgi:hypothetical protein